MSTPFTSAGPGESLTLVGTLFWTFHLLITDAATNYADSVTLTLLQFITVSAIAVVVSCAITPNDWSWRQLYISAPWLLLLSICEGSAFLMAAVGQRYAPPAHAAVICSLEAVFASAAGYVFLGESLNGSELCGCALMLTSSILAQADGGGDGVGEEDGAVNAGVSAAGSSAVLRTFVDTAALLSGSEPNNTAYED